MNRVVGISIISIVLFAMRADAQDLTFYGGYLNPGKLNLANVQNGLNIRDAGIFGARFDFSFRRIIGAEQSISFSSRLFDNRLIPGSSEVRGFLYSSNLMINLPLGRFVPYFTAGVGFMKPWGSGLKPFDAKFAGNYGGGVKLIRLAGPVGLRFDVREHTILNVEHQTLHILEASGGIVFTFR